MWVQFFTLFWYHVCKTLSASELNSRASVCDRFILQILWYRLVLWIFTVHVAEPPAPWLGSAPPRGSSFDPSLVPRAPSLRPKPSDSRRSLRPAFRSFSSPQTFLYVVKRSCFSGLQTETLVWDEGNYHSHQSVIPQGLLRLLDVCWLIILLWIWWDDQLIRCLYRR